MEDNINTRTLFLPFHHQVMSDDIDDMQDTVYHMWAVGHSSNLDVSRGTFF